MSDRRAHAIDRTGWPSGPWDDEPDKVQWKTRAGLPGLVVRNYMGVWCGYAGVPQGHSLYEVDYRNCEGSFDVHGGLTYSAHCMEDGPICHIPDPGEPDDVWWLGFDCAHAGDLVPRHLLHGWWVEDDHYRDLAHVQEEVESLARQLVEVV